MHGDSPTGDRSWVDDAAELLRIVATSDLDLLEVEHRGARFVLRRDPREVAASAPNSGNRSDEERSIETFVVTAQRVGVFRRTASGSGEPPIEEGDRVSAGHVVGGVEAMGVLDRVQTERSGIVEQVLVQDGQPVEYGQELMVVRAE
jgi:acetyl-CoA carboxylase biotin carboxyl carrier protein